MKKVAVIIPVHPPKIQYASQLLKTYEKNKEYIDIFLVFTSVEDKSYFTNILKDDINIILLDDSIDLNILSKKLSYVNFKKLYALNYVSKNFDYDYSIIIDCDSIFLDMKNIYSICERFCIKKEVYGTKCSLKFRRSVTTACKNYINKYSDVKYPESDIDTYFWFSQIPIYDMCISKSFLDFIKIHSSNSIDNITYLTFDYIV